MFRPPYSIDQEPDTKIRCARSKSRRTWVTSPSAARSIARLAESGDARHSAQQIARRRTQSFAAVRTYDQACGNIVLLHDGAEIRSETVKALPAIIHGAPDADSFPFTVDGQDQADVCRLARQ